MEPTTTKDAMTETPIYETLRLEYLAQDPPILISHIRNRPKWSIEDANLRIKRIMKKGKKQ